LKCIASSATMQPRHPETSRKSRRRMAVPRAQETASYRLKLPSGRGWSGFRDTSHRKRSMAAFGVSLRRSDHVGSTAALPPAAEESHSAGGVVKCQSTKSLRDSPLRGGVSRGAGSKPRG
jgi:hypothetical protein